MLEYFRFKNFKSFKDEAILNMVASKSQKFDTQATTIGNTKIINLATLTGYTGSGKSGVLEAMEYAVKFILTSLAYNEKNKYRRNTFALTDNVEDSFFEFGIIQDDTGIHYRYGFRLNDCDVVEETLYKRSRTAREFRPVMRRTQTSFEFQGLQSKLPFKGFPLREGNLMLTYGGYLNIEPLNELYSWFESKFTFLHMDMGGDTSDIRYMLEDKNRRSRFLDIIKQVDDSVTSIKLTSDELTNVFITHGYDSMELGYFLPDECSGIKQIVQFAPALYRAINEGGILVVDNFGEGLHTLLAEYLYKTFAKYCNTGKAQMITATTYTSLLDLTRLDGVWFTSKDKNGCSELYGLRDFKDPCVRVDTDISKNYLAGRYGAVPEQREDLSELLEMSLWS